MATTPFKKTDQAIKDTHSLQFYSSNICIIQLHKAANSTKMSNKTYIVIVCTMICATCLLAAEHDGSGSADQSAQNVSTTVAMPRQVLKQLLDFKKGLFILWSYAFQLKKSTLLKDEVSLHLCMHITTYILGNITTS